MSKTTKDHEKSKFTLDESSNSIVRVTPGGGLSINPLAKYVECSYSNNNKTVCYKYYNSSSKTILYNTVTNTFSEIQDASFVSTEWS